MTDQKPSVGRIVHYVSYGSPVRPDGSQAFTSECRAAVITGVHHNDPVPEHGVPYVDLFVMNPTGVFLNTDVFYDAGGTSDTPGAPAARSYSGGTWHWPERRHSALFSVAVFLRPLQSCSMTTRPSSSRTATSLAGPATARPDHLRRAARGRPIGALRRLRPARLDHRRRVLDVLNPDGPDSTFSRVSLNPPRQSAGLFAAPTSVPQLSRGGLRVRGGRGAQPGTAPFHPQRSKEEHA